MHEDHIEDLAGKGPVAFAVLLQTLHVFHHDCAVFLQLFLVLWYDPLPISFKQQLLCTSISGVQSDRAVCIESCIVRDSVVSQVLLHDSGIFCYALIRG